MQDAVDSTPPPRTTGESRRLWLVGAVLAPFALLAVGWWLVDTLLLTPAAAGLAAPPEALIRYIAHERGLARRPLDEQRALLEQVARRLSTDEDYNARFNSALQRLAEEPRRAFRENLFRAFKPVILGDAEEYARLGAGPPRDAFLDARIVHYNRGRNAFGAAQRERSLLGRLSLDKESLLRLVMSETTARERGMAVEFLNAYGERMREISADETLRAEFQRRTAEVAP